MDYIKRFEARELRPYAEPVSLHELVEGRVYFAVQFVDENLLIPTVEPLIFIGCNLKVGDDKQFYFQNFESYSAGLRYPPSSDEDAMAFQVCGPEEGNHIFEYEHALDVLMRCALARREGKL